MGPSRSAAVVLFQITASANGLGNICSSVPGQPRYQYPSKCAADHCRQLTVKRRQLTINYRCLIAMVHERETNTS